MFYSRLCALCKERGINVTNLIGELKFSAGNLSRWKKGGEPRGNTLSKLADYFQVSTDYLLGRTDDPRSVGEEKEPTPAAEGGPDPELWKLIQQIPESRMPEVERYLRFQAEQKGTP